MPSNQPKLPQLWFAKVEESSVQAAQACKSLFSATENKRFHAMQSLQRQNQFLVSRWLIRKALSKLIQKPVEFWNIEEKTAAFPTIRNLPKGLHLSLSHSHEWIVLAIADAPIGVDIEKIQHRENVADMASVFMTDKEIQQLSVHPEPTLFFYQTWCLKEAYFKSLPLTSQQTISLQKIETSFIQSYANLKVITRSHCVDYQLAIYSENSQQDIQEFHLNPPVENDFFITDVINLT